jgi:YVTN family beta-propeller protein
MKNLLHTMIVLAAILLIISANSSATNYGQRDLVLSSSQSVGLIVEPVREWYSMTTDFDSLVGDWVFHYAFGVRCEGAFSTTVTLTHDNPRFEPSWTAESIQCGSIYLSSFRFSPTEAGITTDNVTFSSELGTVTKRLIGNGVIEETPEYWIADLGPGTSAQRLVYDSKREFLYITDAGNDQVIVFSPSTQAVLSRISVGADPLGLAMTSDQQRLYVANSGIIHPGEYSVSVIDLDTLSELYKIPIPSLYPDPDEYWEYLYTPYEIAIVSDTLALLSNDPPGLASGSPIYQLDLQTREVALRTDIGGLGCVGQHSLFRTSSDFMATGIVGEPGSSPTCIIRYNHDTDVAISSHDFGIERSLAVNNNASRFIITHHLCNELIPNLTLVDQDLNRICKIQLLGCQALAAVFNPVAPKYVYAVEGRVPYSIEEARLDLMRQTRSFSYDIPSGYYPAPNAMVIADDGEWLFALLVQTWNEPPSKLLAIKVGPPEITDAIPPSSTITALPLTQMHNWWFVSWSGADDASGIDYYEIQYRLGQEGNWINWLTASGEGSFFTNAIPGQTYYFRGHAVDKAGNVELYPSDFETYTTAGYDTGGLSQTYLPLIVKD